MDSKKIGRNEPCFCGSGRKFKKCHGALGNNPASQQITDPQVIARLKANLAENEAVRKQQEKQQGLGRPIISNVFQGFRIVAVGNTLHWSRNWKTFHDFLFDYIKRALGPEWGNAEIKKPLEQRHQILQWYDRVCKYQQETIPEPGKVHSAPMIGVVEAYLRLAYNLYLLNHNEGAQAELIGKIIERLKHPDQFLGAYYELFVAASLVRAGFSLVFEDESNSRTSHCEFTATLRGTGRKFSVEVKGREPNKPPANVQRQLRKALAKAADHERIVFIDVNLPDTGEGGESPSYLNDVLRSLRKSETKMMFGDIPAPPAYVILTNHPFLHSLDTWRYRWSTIAEGFKIPDFKLDGPFPTLRAALDAREKHYEIHQLLKSLETHYEIPCTFDGEIPELAYGEHPPRLKIGERYAIPDEGGNEVAGELEDATVLVNEKLVYGVYRLDNGRRIIATCPLSQEEIVAFRKYPDTFFGVERRVGRGLRDPLDCYDFFYEVYRKSSRDKLLEFIKAYPNYQYLETLPQEELAKLYCEYMTYTVLASGNHGEKP